MGSPRISSAWRDGLALAGAALMLAYAVRRLPPASDLIRLPGTPLDRSRIHASAGEYRLLIEAARWVPSAATVLVRSAAGDAERDLYLHRFGVALLPARRVVPSPLAGLTVSSELAGSVEYLVVLGPADGVEGADLLERTPDGSIWRKRRS